jgi:hypothetical protein
VRSLVLISIVVCVISSISIVARADTGAETHASTHAPIAVMGDHVHEKGEVMISYRYMNMDMQGSRLGGDAISDNTIATTIPNRFFGTPGQPPTLRIVPTEMTMEMHMFGLMYAPNDSVTLMAMLNYVEKDMTHTTYRGGRGTNVLGQFVTKTKGVGDTPLAALVTLANSPTYKLHGTIGISLPTGSTTKEDDVLTPMGGTPTVRLPYPMQLGSGTFDPIVGLTYTGGLLSSDTGWGYGAQWRSLFRIQDNDEGYQLGDEHNLTGWVNYQWSPAVSTSLRLNYLDRGKIDGIDSIIVGPVQTADPNNAGLKQLDLGLGVNFAGSGSWNGHRLSAEYLVPLSRDTSGVQLETDATMYFGYQYAF